MDSENNGQGISRLRPPSKLPSFSLPALLRTGGGGIPMTEISDSQSNTLNQPTMVPATQKNPRKHALQPVTEPEPKRKTLAQQAGEYPSTTTAGPAASRSTIQGYTLTSGIKQPTRHAQNGSTTGLPRNNTSTSNFSSTVGPGARPPTSSGHRSQLSKSTFGRGRSKTQTRPATAIGHRPVADEEPTSQAQAPPQGQGQGNPKGTSKIAPRRGGSEDFSLSNRPRAPNHAQSQQRLRPPDFSQYLTNIPEAESARVSKSRDVPGSLVAPHNGGSIVPPPTSSIDENPNVTMRSSRQGISNHPLLKPVESATSVMAQTPPRPSPSKEPETALAEFAELRIAVKNFSPSKSPKKPSFLTKESNTKGFVAWEPHRVEEFTSEVVTKLDGFKEIFDSTLSDKKMMNEQLDFLRSQVTETETKNSSLREELDTARREAHSLSLELESERRARQHDVEDRMREQRHQLDQLRRDLGDEAERQRREHREQLEATERHWKNILEDSEAQKQRETQELKAKLGTEQDGLNHEITQKSRDIENMRGQLEDMQSNLDREKTLKDNFTLQLSAKETRIIEIETRNTSLQNRIDYLQSDSKAQSDSFADMESKLVEAERVAEECRDKLIKEETERRVLFNKYQELKGNIRVMCRVRPVADDKEAEMARIEFPDEKTSAEIKVLGPEERSSLGNISRKSYPFEFDRVFTPQVQNEDVFGEISQLVQSALDGYNVCIFCYGQTGSGKTYTMSSADGMIPRSTHMIYDTITKLKGKSWTYHMEGSFVEVYNEELRDLLVPGGSGNGKKLEIRHDEVKKRTTITNAHVEALDSADAVETMLGKAQRNRSVAATKANEHSSRSHSVFILRLRGENSVTGEKCEGTLNLVDLAGSERLKHSQAEGDRMKETQNINKSLSSLGDVIEALGRKGDSGKAGAGGGGGGHIPYRNSRLTHLLQYSLGGNSKTLMFVMVSPLEAHFQETVASLKFATKVHNTHIGTAKTTKKVAGANGVKAGRSSDS